MKKIFIFTLLSVSALFVTPLQAAIQTVTLSLPGMNCAVCPITVKKALKNIQGVNTVEVNFDSKKAVVKFDDAKTNTEALTKATTDAGYPSTVMQ